MFRLARIAATIAISTLGCVKSGTPTAPVIDTVSPANGLQGENVPLTITGSFSLDIRVHFDNADNSTVDTDFQATLGTTVLTDVQYVDNHTLTATAPDALALGLHDLTITDPAGRTGSMANAFEVLLDPPTDGPADGGDDGDPVPGDGGDLDGDPDGPAAIYVRVGGSDTDTGGGPGTALGSLQEAVTRALPGDEIVVGAGTYSGVVTFDASGTSANPIVFTADTDGTLTGDSGPVVLNGDGTTTTALLGADYVTVDGFTFTGATGGEGLAVAANSTGIKLLNIVAHGNATGALVQNSDGVLIENGRIYGNSQTGIDLRTSNGTIVRNTLIYENASKGIDIGGLSLGTLVENCTLYHNDSIQIDAGPNATVTIRNTIITDGNAEGVRAGTGATVTSSFNNVWNNNGGNYVGFTMGTGDINANPIFEDPDGPDNFLGDDNDQFQLTPAPQSPCIDAGAADATTVVLDDGSTLADRTTRLDGTTDSGVVDMGYHYPAP